MNFKLKSKLLLVLFSFLMVVTARVSATPDLSLAVVDVTILQQQFLSEVNDKLAGEFKEKQSALQRNLDEFKNQQEGFEKDSKTMTTAQVTTLANDLRAKQNELQLKVQQFDQEISARRQEELQGKLKILFGVVQEISNKEKYDMVLAKTAALYVADKYDITQKVVEGYKKAEK